MKSESFLIDILHLIGLLSLYTDADKKRGRPYVLREYFDTQLLIAESRGKIAHDFHVFFMGHKGSMEAKYTINKGILPQLLIDEMRNAFSRSEEFLDLEKGDVPKIEQKEISKSDTRRK